MAGKAAFPIYILRFRRLGPYRAELSLKSFASQQFASPEASLSAFPNFADFPQKTRTLQGFGDGISDKPMLLCALTSK
jgi:hypothetical protein